MPDMLVSLTRLFSSIRTQDSPSQASKSDDSELSDQLPDTPTPTRPKTSETQSDDCEMAVEIATPAFQAQARRSSKKTPTKTNAATAAADPDKVASGRVEKTTRKSPAKARKKRAEVYSDDDDLDDDFSTDGRFRDDLVQAEDPVEAKKRLHAQMAEEKGQVQGSDQWARGEEKLFEVLFMRQFRPVLPSHWTVDFRGIPAPETLFATSDEEKPVIYALHGNDLPAARALIRMVELTGNTRALVQSGLPRKASRKVLDELRHFQRWAAKDGGYAHLDHLPNIVIEQVRVTSANVDLITEHMQSQLRKLARQHLDLLEASRSPLPPPVIYGLFVIQTTVLVLTLDAAKLDAAGPVSYHVETDFNQSFQGVWNAITVAIPLCMARDDLKGRLELFKPLPPVEESDVDL